MSQAYQSRRKPHLEQRHRTYLAVLEVPRALRPKLGRRFVRSLETDSPAVAERRAAPIIAGWRRQIAEARGDKSAGDDAAFFRRALRNAKTEAERQMVKDVIWDAAYEVGIIHGAGIEQDPQDVPEAGEFYGRATATPFDDLLAEWQSTSRVIRKTKDMQAADVKRFTVKFPTVEDVTKPEVKRWADGLLVGGLAPKTVQRILWSLRSYWRHLQSVSVAPSELAPFAGLAIARGGRVSSEDERKAFPAADVVKLREAATARKDQDLADLITMAMFTGARIEELCSLAVENVKLGAEVPHVTIIAGKTDAALRDVPIHADLLPVLRRLIGERTKGFVLADLTANKYDDRSNAIGKRFKTLARGLDFGPAYVFHSIRKTVAGLFKDAMVPEFVAAEILGHELATMSYGLYGRGAVSLATKREAIDKLHYLA